jgi:RecA/RadA recombinase
MSKAASVETAEPEKKFRRARTAGKIDDSEKPPVVRESVKKARREVEVISSKDDESYDDMISAIRTEIPELMVPDDKGEVMGVMVRDWIPMPPPILEAMKTPGIPCGHIIQIVGHSDTGKTTFALHAVKSVQDCGGIALWLDFEHKFPYDRAIEMGIDMKRLLLVQPKTIEQGFSLYVRTLKVMRAKNKTKKIVLVWDSIGSAPCEWELDEEKGDYAPAAAKAIKGGLRKTRYFLDEVSAAVILINQFYTRTDLRGPSAMYAKKTKAYGGEGPTYFSSMILEFKRIGSLSKTVKGEKVKIGTKSIIENVKNHLGEPFGTVEIEIDKLGVRWDGRE